MDGILNSSFGLQTPLIDSQNAKYPACIITDIVVKLPTHEGIFEDGRGGTVHCYKGSGTVDIYNGAISSVLIWIYGNDDLLPRGEFFPSNSAIRITESYGIPAYGNRKIEMFVKSEHAYITWDISKYAGQYSPFIVSGSSRLCVIIKPA